MRQPQWLKQHRWLIAGSALALLALAAILTTWAVQAHQYQLALAHYNATQAQPTTVTNVGDGIPGQNGSGAVSFPAPAQPPPVDTSGPAAWGWAGWVFRLLAIFVPLFLGLFLEWRAWRAAHLHVHAELGHAANRLAEAIVTRKELPTGVFDAYSKLRELEAQKPPSKRPQRPKRS